MRSVIKVTVNLYRKTPLSHISTFLKLNLRLRVVYQVELSTFPGTRLSSEVHLLDFTREEPHKR